MGQKLQLAVKRLADIVISLLVLVIQIGRAHV